MTAFRFVVYDPPLPDFPYLAVMVTSEGQLVAIPFKTAAEAEAHNKTAGEGKADKMREDGS